MHPDWQCVKRLLLVSLLDQDSQSELLQSLPLLQQSLPETSISVLAAFPDSLFDQPLATLDLIPFPSPFFDLTDHASSLIQSLKARSFDAAIVFTLPQQSPYLIAYCCYLAGIPIRVGQSCEFGGGVLSHCVKPPLDPVNALEYQLHLLRSVNLIPAQTIHLISSSSFPVQSADTAMA